jgi:uncharacterized protein
MLYNVAQLLKSPVGTDLLVSFEGEIDLASNDAEIVGPIEGEARMQRTNQGVLVSGEFDATASMMCVRCLDGFEESFHLTFSDMFMPTIEVNSGHPLPRITEDDVFEIDKHHHLNLTDALRQQIILALPMQPLCRENCAGLCPICGANHNVTSCQCESEIHPQWGALAELSQNLADNDEQQ